MYALRSRSKYLLSSTRLYRIQHSDRIESRNYSGQSSTAKKFDSSCFCSSTSTGNDSRRYRRFLSSNHHGLFFNSTAALSFFGRSNPQPPPPTSPEIGLPSDSKYSMEEIGPIPEPPMAPTPESLNEMQMMIADNLREIGLGSYLTPVGWIQNFMDMMHSTTGLPWWEVIVLSTILVRCATFPVMVYSQRRVGKMKLHQEDMQKLMAKAEDAKRTGDMYEYQLAMMDVQEFMKERGIAGISSTMIPLAVNGVVFASYFFALRRMATANMWSLHSEGTLWFTDLTLSDPTFILPAVCSLTLLVMMELGTEFGAAGMNMKPWMRWMMRLMPLGILVVGRTMPSAILVYWTVSNFISLLISMMFRVPKVRVYLKLPAMPPKTKKATSWAERLSIPQSVQNFVVNPRVLWWGIKDLRKNRLKSARAPTATDIRKGDTKRFKAAGEGPIPPTFTFNPKTKYKEVFEKKSLMTKLKGTFFGGGDKKLKASTTSSGVEKKAAA